MNALAASDGVIIPMQCEYYALEGLSQLMVTIKQVKRLYNRGLDITGILVTMYNGRLNLSLQVMDELKKYYAGKALLHYDNAKRTPERGARLRNARALL